MFRAEPSSQGLAVNRKPSLEKSSAFLKAGAKITILTVLSRQVKNQASLLKSTENSKGFTKLPNSESKTQELQKGDSKALSMNCTNLLPTHCEGNSVMNKKTNEVEEGHVGTVVNGDCVDKGEPVRIAKDNTGKTDGSTGMTNGISKVNEENGDFSDANGENENGVFVDSFAIPEKDAVVSKNRINNNDNYEKRSGNQDMTTPFDFMKERKLSEPVMSPRKRSSLMTSSMLSRCRSTLDLRENEKPILRELGGYKFFQKPNNNQETSTKKRAQGYRANETQTNDVATLKKTLLHQKENIVSREKHVLQLERKISLLETENSKNKKHISSLREKVKDCSGTVDFLRREKDLLASEKDRLNFTLLTYEDELKELRSQNVNLVDEYENAEQSRKIAVGHLHELQKAYQESVVAVGSKNSKKQHSDSRKRLEKLREQLNSWKGRVHELRNDREALMEEFRRMVLFFTENMKVLKDRVYEMETQVKKVESVDDLHESVNEERVSPGQENVVEREELIMEEKQETDLEKFKKKLKSNEELIDRLANEIRDLENKKKGLLESRFEMIQDFQGGREIAAEDWEEEVSEKEEKKEESAETGNRKQSSRVTRKIRKLERTLSMDHGVGKLDCIQKLCKKLEDCEQKVQELEVVNKELREEHDDMEEETKYLKYVLSYRGDVVKAQLETEYEKKMTALREELRVAEEAASERLQDEFQGLIERNRVLEEEVQRLHEELKCLVMNLPALQDGSEQRSRPESEVEGDLSQNSEEAVRGLEEKVAQLTEEKRVLLLSMQTLTDQRTSLANSINSENDSSFSRNVLVLEKNLRDVENENACLAETLQRIRDVLDDDDDEVSGDQRTDSSKISKLKDEIGKLDEKPEIGKRSVFEDSLKDEVFLTCTRHEERISELEKEVTRLHEEKKSLLSTIIRLQTDPNFTFSDDFTDGDVSKSSLESPMRAMIQAAARDEVDGTGAEGTAVDSAIRTLSSSPLPGRSFRDEEVQVVIYNEELQGLVGYLQRDLERLKTALGAQSFMGHSNSGHQEQAEVPHNPNEHNCLSDMARISHDEKEVDVLQEKLEESEAIRSDLHRTISIATDMASEERQKCAELMHMKAAMEKDMLKLAKENRELRDALEASSRVRKRRNSRAQHMNRASVTSESHEEDGMVSYLPRAKPQNYSESEFSDIDSPAQEASIYSRVE